MLVADKRLHALVEVDGEHQVKTRSAPAKGTLISELKRDIKGSLERWRPWWEDWIAERDRRFYLQDTDGQNMGSNSSRNE